MGLGCQGPFKGVIGIHRAKGLGFKVQGLD